MYKIKLPSAYPQKGKVVVNNRVFEDGACLVNDADAQLVVPVFKSFYGATIEKVADEAPADESKEPSLKSGQTKS
ncbi:MAG: hypothetical protein LC131_00245 [Anaerolineae bacterium]|nr:hypothetical protein [Anaerolineae bacterium]